MTSTKSKKEAAVVATVFVLMLTPLLGTLFVMYTLAMLRAADVIEWQLPWTQVYVSIFLYRLAKAAISTNTVSTEKS